MKRLLLISVLFLAGCSSELEKPEVVTDGKGCYAINFGGVISTDTCMKKEDAEKKAVEWHAAVKDALDKKERVKTGYKVEGK